MGLPAGPVLDQTARVPAPRTLSLKMLQTFGVGIMVGMVGLAAWVAYECTTLAAGLFVGSQGLFALAFGMLPMALVFLTTVLMVKWIVLGQLRTLTLTGL